MIVTGMKLKEAIRDWETQRKIAAGLFKTSLHFFEDERETAMEPAKVMSRYMEAEDAVATLQTAQMRYNLAVEVKVQDKTMTLAEAVKRIGGAGRAEAMWRSAATEGIKLGRWDQERRLTRSVDEERARMTLPRDTAIKLTRAAARHASALREAMAIGNTREIEIESLAPALFQ